jgi:hypothetical protein
VCEGQSTIGFAGNDTTQEAIVVQCEPIYGTSFPRQIP